MGLQNTHETLSGRKTLKTTTSACVRNWNVNNLRHVPPSSVPDRANGKDTKNTTTWALRLPARLRHALAANEKVLRAGPCPGWLSHERSRRSLRRLALDVPPAASARAAIVNEATRKGFDSHTQVRAKAATEVQLFWTKTPGGGVRSRWVAREHNTGPRPDVFSATSALEGAKLVISEAASSNTKGSVLLVRDVRRVYFNGKATRRVYVELPEKDGGGPSSQQCGMLRKSLCMAPVTQLRTGSGSWQDSWRRFGLHRGEESTSFNSEET